jgi:hypothetical protein
MAARNEPATFYQVLSQLSQLNPQGIQDVMTQRENIRLKREEMATRVQERGDAITRHKEEKDNMYVDRVRASMRDAGVLGDFERDTGKVLTSVKDAEMGEVYVSDTKGGEKREKDKLALLKEAAHNPGLQLTGPGKKYYTGDEAFKESWDSIKLEGARKLQVAEETRLQRTTMVKLRIQQAQKTLDRMRNLNPADRLQFQFEMRKLQNLHNEWMKMDTQMQKQALYAQYLKGSAADEFERLKAATTDAESVYDEQQWRITSFIDNLDASARVDAPPARPGAAPAPAPAKEVPEDDDMVTTVDIDGILKDLQKKNSAKAKEKSKKGG